ncbi:uncharacterized protein LOC144351899 [Saccoglossus kowalevskii]
MQVYCTSLYEDKMDKDDAESKGVELVFPKKGSANPSLEWLTEKYHSYFPHLAELSNVEIVIGHVPITAQAALDIRDQYFKGKEVYLFNHVIPSDIEVHKPGWSPEIVDVKEENILEWVKKCQMVWSIGPRIYKHFENCFRALDEKVRHDKYLPNPDPEFFDMEFKKPIPGTRVNVLTFGRVLGVENLKGYDIVAKAMSKFADQRCRFGGSAPIWKIRGIPERECDESRQKISSYINSAMLQPDLRPYGNQDNIRCDIKQSHLVIMASRSEPFGMVGLEAIAAGIPVLVTAQSGLAEFLNNNFGRDMVKPLIVEVGVNDFKMDDNIELWEKHIIEMLGSEEEGYEDVFNRAASLKERLRNCQAIKTSQRLFKSHVSK